ncbi:hypothetical protein DFJ74DRAFT_508480 [Hyaloraphidium curvatum]|nr:hypothetical protein DFJ74DRAFT_508480 [Hyaloraphidium curvatum]
MNTPQFRRGTGIKGRGSGRVSLITNMVVIEERVLVDDADSPEDDADAEEEEVVLPDDGPGALGAFFRFLNERSSSVRPGLETTHMSMRNGAYVISADEWLLYTELMHKAMPATLSAPPTYQIHLVEKVPSKGPFRIFLDIDGTPEIFSALGEVVGDVFSWIEATAEAVLVARGFDISGRIPSDRRPYKIHLRYPKAITDKASFLTLVDEIRSKLIASFVDKGGVIRNGFPDFKKLLDCPTGLRPLGSLKWDRDRRTCDIDEYYRVWGEENGRLGKTDWTLELYRAASILPDRRDPAQLAACLEIENRVPVAAVAVGPLDIPRVVSGGSYNATHFSGGKYKIPGDPVWRRRYAERLVEAVKSGETLPDVLALSERLDLGALGRFIVDIDVCSHELPAPEFQETLADAVSRGFADWAGRYGVTGADAVFVEVNDRFPYKMHFRFPETLLDCNQMRSAASHIDGALGLATSLAPSCDTGIYVGGVHLRALYHRKHAETDGRYVPWRSELTVERVLGSFIAPSDDVDLSAATAVRDRMVATGVIPAFVGGGGGGGTWSLVTDPVIREVVAKLFPPDRLAAALGCSASVNRYNIKRRESKYLVFLDSGGVCPSQQRKNSKDRHRAYHQCLRIQFGPTLRSCFVRCSAPDTWDYTYQVVPALESVTQQELGRLFPENSSVLLEMSQDERREAVDVARKHLARFNDLALEAGVVVVSKLDVGNGAIYRVGFADIEGHVEISRDQVVLKQPPAADRSRPLSDSARGRLFGGPVVALSEGRMDEDIKSQVEKLIVGNAPGIDSVDSMIIDRSPVSGRKRVKGGIARYFGSDVCVDCKVGRWIAVAGSLGLVFRCDQESCQFHHPTAPIALPGGLSQIFNININIDNRGRTTETTPLPIRDLDLFDFVPGPFDTLRKDVVAAKHDPEKGSQDQPELVKYLNHYMCRLTMKPTETFYFRRFPSAPWMERASRNLVQADLRPYFPVVPTRKNPDAKVDIFEIFMDSEIRREVDTVDYVPSREGDFDRTLNLFGGLAGKVLDEVVREDDPRMRLTMKHFNEVICSMEKSEEGEVTNVAVFEDISRWLAWIVQKRSKTGVMVLLYGQPGTGKNLFADFIRIGVIGLANSREVAGADFDHQVAGRFNSGDKTALLTVLNEVPASTERRAYDKVKSIVTDEHRVVETKHKNPEAIVDHQSIMALSNHLDAVNPTKLTLRRLFATAVSNRYLGNTSYFTDLKAEMETADARAAFTTWLSQIDLEGWHPDKMRATELVQAMVAGSQSPLEAFATWVLNLGADEWKGIKFEKGHAFNMHDLKNTQYKGEFESKRGDVGVWLTRKRLETLWDTWGGVHGLQDKSQHPHGGFDVVCGGRVPSYGDITKAFGHAVEVLPPKHGFKKLTVESKKVRSDKRSSDAIFTGERWSMIPRAGLFRRDYTDAVGSG